MLSNLQYSTSDQVSISSTLNEHLFCTNVVLAAFSMYMYIEKSCRNDVCMKNLHVNVDEIDGK